ncbi:MAG: STAS domain-containing protein [Pirellulaceae bacterium]|nr:STAS domain-containing protein [Pirellulaceae bacterium]
MNSFAQIKTEAIGDMIAVTINANRVMDPVLIGDLGQELQTLFDSQPGKTFLLDLHNIEFLSSAVLNRLIVLDKSVKSAGGTMAFYKPSTAVSEVFSITKLDLLFQIYEDRAAAIAALG